MPVLLNERIEFPDPREADRKRSGLVAVGGDLSIERLLLAYRHGIFPWTVKPITWWSPEPRAIFELDQFHLPESVRKLAKRCLFSGTPRQKVVGIAHDGFEVTVDCAFREVIANCAFIRQEGNWISPEFIEAYVRLHEAGHAHSVECWKEGVLAGGIYGVAIGSSFAGESMFYRVSNASKIALLFLVQRLRERGFTLFDIQMLTPTTAKFGAITITRDEYLERLATAVARPDCW
jgi:leucyl/phenylalanyl-tRNA--protein transferase